ncbi:MAG: deoxyribose-phosphate aldolase [Natronomonas sp.]|jgi:deoxyribose-phosphate aldolase
MSETDSTDIPARIEHTVLGPTTTAADVREAVTTAADLGMRACVPPRYVPTAVGTAPAVETVTVVGFPHGHHQPAVKASEARRAVADGASEVDTVAALGPLLAGEEGATRADIEAVVDAVDVPVKAIVEAPLLEEGQLRRACAAARDAGAAFLKTATGFSEGGATVADVEVMSEFLPVKASGGVGSWPTARAMFEAGAERVGASSGGVIVQEYLDATEAGEG